MSITQYYSILGDLNHLTSHQTKEQASWVGEDALGSPLYKQNYCCKQYSSEVFTQSWQGNEDSIIRGIVQILLVLSWTVDYVIKFLFFLMYLIGVIWLLYESYMIVFLVWLKILFATRTLTIWLTHWTTDQPTERLIDWLIEGCIIGLLAGPCLSKSFYPP